MDNIIAKETIPDGYIKDFISGENVKATPEEINAVQVYSKILVSDYGYKKNRFRQDHSFE